MDKTKALNILELNAEASEKQINKKFEIILKQAKFDQTINTKTVCEAYDFLTKNYSYKDENKSELKRKFENFSYYHLKLVIFIIGISIFITLGIIFVSLYIKAHPKPDLTVVFIGEYQLSEATIKHVENYFNENLYIENVDVLSLKIVETETSSYYEYTLDEIIETTNNIEPCFIIANGSSILDLKKEESLTGLSYIELKKLDLSQGDDRLYSLYGKTGTLIPYIVKPYGKDFLGVDGILEDFPFIAIPRSNMFNSEIYSIIATLLQSN